MNTPPKWDMATVTLEEVASWLLENMAEGAECPCCGQLCKVYKRAFNSAMARSLIWLVNQAPDAATWVDVPLQAPGWLTRSRELPKTRYWGLIEEKPNLDPTKRCSGIWRPTQAGVDFVFSRVSVSSHVYLFNNTVEGFAETRVLIRDVLGKDFDYSELLSDSQ